MSIEFNHPVFDEGDIWREESWTYHGGQTTSWHLPMEVDVCVYVDGKHVYPGPDCPHGYNGEELLEPEPGWTVLNIRKG